MSLKFEWKEPGNILRAQCMVTWQSKRAHWLQRQVEEDIVDVVVGLNCVGIKTLQSCGGHIKEGNT